MACHGGRVIISSIARSLPSSHGSGKFVTESECLSPSFCAILPRLFLLPQLLSSRLPSLPPQHAPRPSRLAAIVISSPPDPTRTATLVSAPVPSFNASRVYFIVSARFFVITRLGLQLCNPPIPEMRPRRRQTAQAFSSPPASSLRTRRAPVSDFPPHPIPSQLLAPIASISSASQPD